MLDLLLVDTRAIGTDQVPGSQGKGKYGKAVRHPCIPAGMDLPATPDGDSCGNDHEGSAEWIHELVQNTSERMSLMTPKRAVVLV